MTETNQVGGDVDHEYCARVTLAYLAKLDAKKETNMSMPCTHCAGTGDKFDDEKKDWAKPHQDCTNCKGWGEVDENH